MKVCFIEPKGVHRGLNTGLAYLCASVKAPVKVFDFNNNSADIDKRLNEISTYDVIGFSLKSLNIRDAVRMAQRIKTRNNILIAGGVHISVDGYNFLKDHQIFDIAVSGEGECVINDIVSSLNNGQPRLHEIPGVYYRQKDMVVRTEDSQRVKALPSLPFPDYTGFDSFDGRISNYPLITSRGCPYNCTYCCVRKAMGRKWYANSPERIVEELKNAVKEYKISRFNIQDDDFTLDVERAKDICTLLIKENMNLVWSCPNGIRADRVDRELLELMKKAGCFAITVGIESGNPREFEAIKKGEKLEEIAGMIKTAREVGMDVYGNFIIGLPFSTLASIRKTVKFAEGLRLDSSIFNLLIPFPGTESWEWVNSHGRWLMDWKDGFMQSTNPRPVFDTDDFPQEERIQAYREANIHLKNYFAFMDEQEGLFMNIFRVLSVIYRYDRNNIFSHLLWLAHNYWRVWERILYKNR